VNLIIKAVKQLIWAHLSNMILTVIIDELHKKKQLCSYYLIFWSICSQIVLDNLIQSFTLTVYLRVISNRKILFNHLNLTDFLLKIWSNVRISIYHNASQKVKIILNMFKKKLHEVCSYKVILSKYKQCILYNMIYYNQNAIIFLIILY